MTDQPRRARPDLTKEELERLEKYGLIAFQERGGGPGSADGIPAT
jgi:hypothetical protein